MSQEHIARKLMRAQRQFTQDMSAMPETVFVCWCGEHITLDYFQFGIREMTFRFNQWIDAHVASCTPQAMFERNEELLAQEQIVA